ncbi:MAG: 50S ribosomal protein L35 [bacterium]|nr:50S ribosomal protein L35 [candidate division WOR-3 bacterium]
MKIKTLRSLSKRIKITGTGKYVRHKAGKRHILSSKSRKRKRQLSKPVVVNKTVTSKMKRLLPY